MNDKNEFYTLTGYKLKNKKELTEAMEDYLEMAYRIYIENKRIRVSDLSSALHVKPSSVSKMMNKLKEMHFIFSEKYKDITLTKTGLEIGAYLLFRHNTLVHFFTYLNENNYALEQVEKIEHFIDKDTLYHMHLFLEKKINQKDS